MKEQYKILYKGGEGEITEKKSRFIATIRPVETEEEAAAFIAEMKKRYWDASHNCSAFVIGDENPVARCSDDREPAQTAGRPMLDVLLGMEVHNVCAVVTRYFGGVLLGTGGLVRAYAKAVREGLAHCVILEKCLADRVRLSIDYSGLGKLQYILSEAGIAVLDSQYGEAVEMTILAPAAESRRIQKKITEGTNGRCGMELQGQVYYGMDAGEIVLLGEG